ncbi:hypothetical protein [Chroococcidiopsis sp. CCNUC1]|uniref:hypothetical protein n=1 Tax=Chroococcidiopsis sp. CCNUC1 TaxID=2653189 RepID=UPI002020243D|nr:hypothetical protein [Chroococcidiopsis sp. CCNUC1]URD48663.1 hypothetical protein M5J74_20290 [Chroococcidiopsis sp. CCNUC1]
MEKRLAITFHQLNQPQLIFYGWDACGRIFSSIQSLGLDRYPIHRNAGGCTYDGTKMQAHIHGMILVSIGYYKYDISNTVSF